MKKVMTIDDVKEYFNKEYEDVKFLLENPPRWVKPNEVINNAICRCLGVAFFAQRFLEFAEIDDEYTVIKRNLEALLEDYRKGE